MNNVDVKDLDHAKKLVNHQRYDLALPILQILFKAYPQIAEIKSLLDLCEQFEGPIISNDSSLHQTNHKSSAPQLSGSLPKNLQPAMAQPKGPHQYPPIYELTKPIMQEESKFPQVASTETEAEIPIDTVFF